MNAEAGTITYGEPVSLDYALENAPEIVKATIDREVVIIKPHLTPLYTLGAKHAKKNKDAMTRPGQFLRKNFARLGSLSLRIYAHEFLIREYCANKLTPTACS